MRVTDIALIVAGLGWLAVVEAGNRVEVTPHETAAPVQHAQLITCPLRKPDFATVMQAAMLGDGTLLVEQQTNTRVHHIKDC
ncbi:Uncharacterised protein [Starkeya nomas]|uniref:Uncharacterized protein n=2 Tax=Xanthobacteraceae TaxID=335928 RepID=A0A5S9PDG9_9HYPH|nr:MULTISPECIES: hypothetical protein [Xanthobacteraceae]TSJ60610.1 hypothetical protein FO470_17885 [Ancylobacter moscoviensis]CAA0101874.1 Uncharacterised protein [Starkeya nomas]